MVTRYDRGPGDDNAARGCAIALLFVGAVLLIGGIAFAALWYALT